MQNFFSITAHKVSAIKTFYHEKQKSVVSALAQADKTDLCHSKTDNSFQIYCDNAYNGKMSTCRTVLSASALIIFDTYNLLIYCCKDI